MKLLPPTKFISIVASSKRELGSISLLISKYMGSQAADRFLDACDKNDYSEANEILEKLVFELTGCDSVSAALDDFAKKFSDDIDNIENLVRSSYIENEKVKIINSFSNQIEAIIIGGENNELS